jgi:ADP-heptose:LPS heptosyltransferase
MMKSHDLSWQRKFLSFILSVMCLPSILIKRELPKTVSNILIIEWNYLGDIVVASPAVRAVKENCPDASVFLLTNPENKEYVDSFSFINRAIYIENPLQLGRRKFSLRAIVDTILLLRSRPYDLVIELSGRLTSQFFLFFIKSKYKVGQNPTQNFYFLDRSVDSGRKHQIERNFDVLKLLNMRVNSLSLWDPSGEREEQFVEKSLAARNVCGKYVVIHPLGSWAPKSWSPGNWKIVAEYLIVQGLTVIFVGSPGEFSRIEAIREGLDDNKSLNFCGALNIIQLISLMKRAFCFMGTDSGPMHIAAIAGLKSFVVFGPGDPDKWSYQKHTVLYKKPDCGPCPQLAYRTLCAKGLKTCKGLLEITPQEVIEKYQESSTSVSGST